MTMNTIAVTIGDPAGIGPEVVRKALADPEIAALARWIVVGESPPDVTPGRLDARCGAVALESVRIATEMCLRGEAAAMVTAPLNKEAVTLSGRAFTGHTEYIAELCGVKESRMLLWNDRLAVVHVS